MMAEENTTTQAPSKPDTQPPAQKRFPIALALVPITPVPFTDDQKGLWAWGRLAVYGAGAALVWKKSPALGKVLAGAAGLSLVTSLAGSIQQ